MIEKDRIMCLGKYFATPIGAIRVPENINNKSFETIGFEQISEKDSQGTIFENANYFHYLDPKIDKNKKLDLQAQILMLKALGIKLTPNEDSQILGITKEDIEKQVAEIRRKNKEEQEQAKSKKREEIRRHKMGPRSL